MARERDVQREQSTPETADPLAPAAESSAPTRFSSAGPLPEIAPTAAPRPTASELAYEKGPGITALEALLAEGRPDPERVVALLDKHRDESSAMFALLESKLGSGFVAEVRESMGLRASVSRREVVAGDPTDEDGGYFIASAKEQGARWRTENGRFSGTAGKNGADATYRVDEDDAVRARVDKKGNGTVAWERDGKSQGELYRSKNELGLRRSWDVDGGQVTAGARHRTHDHGATDELFGTHRSADGATTTDAALGVHDGEAAAMLGVTHKPSASETVTGRLTHDANVTSLAGSYDTPARRIDGSVTRGSDQTSIHLGDTERLSPQLTVGGSLDHVQRDSGSSQTSLSLTERYRTSTVAQSFGLQAGTGERDYLGANGSIDAQLAPNLYGGAFGSFRIEDGHQQQAQLGASLTFTPTEKSALTLAGVLDESGALETRLQLDVFRSRIAGVGGIADHKKDALVSLFLSYSTGDQRRMLDDRFGSPQIETGDERVTAGIKIRF